MKKTSRLLALLLALVMSLALVPTAGAIDTSVKRLERIDLNMNEEWKAECNSGYSCAQVHKMLKDNKVYQVADTTDSHFNISILGLYARCHVKSSNCTTTKNLWFPGSDSLLANHPFANSSLDHIPNASDYEEFGVVLKVTWGSGYTVNQSKLPTLYINGKKASLGTCDRDFHMCSDKSIKLSDSTTAYLWFDITPGKPTANTSGISNMTLKMKGDSKVLSDNATSYIYKGVTVTYQIEREGIHADQIPLEWRLTGGNLQSTRIVSSDDDSVTVQVCANETNNVLGLSATGQKTNKYTGERFQYNILLRLGSYEDGVKRLEVDKNSVLVNGGSSHGADYKETYPHIYVKVRNKGLWAGSKEIKWTVTGNTKPITLKKTKTCNYNDDIYTEFRFATGSGETSKNITFTFSAADEPSVQTVYRTSWGKYKVNLYQNGVSTVDTLPVYCTGRYATDTVPECDFEREYFFKGWYILDSSGKPWKEMGLFYPGDPETYNQDLDMMAELWDKAPIDKQPEDRACLPFGGEPDKQEVALDTAVIDPTQVKEVYLERYDEVNDRWGKVEDATGTICTQESMYTNGVRDWKNSNKHQAVFYSKSTAISGLPLGTAHVFFTASLANTGKYRVKFVLNDGTKVMTRRFTEEFGGEIQHVRLKDMILPALGQTAYTLGGTPSLTINGKTGSGVIALAEPSYFSSAYLAWYDKSSGKIVNGTFTPGNEYYYRLNLTAADGYSLPEGYDSSCYARDFFQVAYLDERIDKPDTTSADVTYKQGDYLYHRMTDLCNVYYLSDTLFIQSPTYTCQSTGDLIRRVNIQDLVLPQAGDSLVAELNRGFQKENETARITADYGGTGRLAASPIESYYVSWNQSSGTTIDVRAGQQRYAYIVINFKYGFTPALKNENEFDGEIIFNDGDGSFELRPDNATKLSTQNGAKWELIIRTKPLTIPNPNTREVEGLIADDTCYPGGLVGVTKRALNKLDLRDKAQAGTLEYTWEYSYQNENGVVNFRTLTEADTGAVTYRLPADLSFGGCVRCTVYDPEDKQAYASNWAELEPCTLSFTVDTDNAGAPPADAAVILTGTGFYNEGMDYVIVADEEGHGAQEINPGTYSVRLSCQGYRDQLLGVKTLDVGEQTLEFAPMKTCSIELLTTRIAFPVGQEYASRLQVSGSAPGGIVYTWNGNHPELTAAGLLLNSKGSVSTTNTPGEVGTYSTLVCLYEGSVADENLLLARYVTVAILAEGDLEEVEIYSGPTLDDAGTTTLTLSYTPGLEDVENVIAARIEDGQMTDLATGTLEGSMFTLATFPGKNLTAGRWTLFLLKDGLVPLCEELTVPAAK